MLKHLIAGASSVLVVIVIFGGLLYWTDEHFFEFQRGTRCVCDINVIDCDFKITGKVVSFNKKPIPEAEILVIVEDEEIRAVASRSGEFLMESPEDLCVNPAHIMMHVSKTGFEPSTYRVKTEEKEMVIELSANGS